VWLLLGLALGFGLAGCANVTLSELTDQNKALNTTWSDCVRQAVGRLDDGKSDPVSIAYGVAPQCAAQYQALTEESVNKYITEGVRANMRQVMKENEIKLITSAILTRRSDQTQL
jgi:hypothetical protein